MSDKIKAVARLPREMVMPATNPTKKIDFRPRMNRGLEGDDGSHDRSHAEVPPSAILRQWPRLEEEGGEDEARDTKDDSHAEGKERQPL